MGFLYHCRVGFDVCFGCVLGVYGVRHRWTAGVSVVLNHSPLPSMQAHTHIHRHTHTYTSLPPLATRKRPLKHSQLLLYKTAY